MCEVLQMGAKQLTRVLPGVLTREPVAKLGVGSPSPSRNSFRLCCLVITSNLGIFTGAASIRFSGHLSKN